MENRNAYTKYETVEWKNPRNGEIVQTVRVVNPQIEFGNTEPEEDIHDFEDKRYLVAREISARFAGVTKLNPELTQ